LALGRISREVIVGKEATICDDVIERLERLAIFEFGIRERVALHDERGRVIVQDHVHARKAASGGVLLLPVQCDLGAGFSTAG
jgi:hypothetical protein